MGMPPAPVPSRPTIARPAGVYQGGTYTPEEPTTSIAVPPALIASLRGTVYSGHVGTATEPIGEQTGSLTGAILNPSRATPRIQPTRKRSRLTTALIVTGSIVVFLGALGTVVYLLAGDFLRALIHAITKV